MKKLKKGGSKESKRGTEADKESEKQGKTLV